MKIRTFAIAAGMLALGLATWMLPSKVQGQNMFDRVNVNLPYSVTIGDRTLQPGEYVIQQLRDAGGGSRVLLIYSDNGMKFETSAMTIPALENKTQEDTKVILHHFGSDYYFSKIWIQGKDYGYEFPLPDSVKAREKEATEPTTVAATYQPVPSETAPTPQSAAPETQTTPQPTTTAQTTPPAQETSPPVQETPPPAVTAPTTPAPETAPTTTAETPISENTANREMPSTSAGWLTMLLSGGALSGAGLTLRRKR